MRSRNGIVAALVVVLAALIGASVPAAAVAAADTEAPTTPTGLSVQHLGFTSVTLAWNPSTDDSGWLLYEVEVQALPTHAQRYAALEPTKTFTGLPMGTTFTATVVAVDGAHNRSSTTSIQFTTPTDVTTPTAPTNLRPVLTGGVLTALAWDPATDDSPLSYRIIADGDFVFGTSGTTVDVFELLFVFCVIEPGSTHTITIRAVDIAHHVSAPSNSLTVTFPATSPFSG